MSDTPATQNWNSRLALFIDDSATPLTPVTSFSSSFTLGADVIHSLERTHVGVVYSPKTITFTFTVNAAGPAAAQITSLAMQGKPFQIRLAEASDDDIDWSFAKIVLSDCIVTSAAPTTAALTGVPTATFSGFSLKAEADTKGQGATTITVP